MAGSLSPATVSVSSRVRHCEGTSETNRCRKCLECEVVRTLVTPPLPEVSVLPEDGSRGRDLQRSIQWSRPFSESKKLGVQGVDGLPN